MFLDLKLKQAYSMMCEASRILFVSHLRPDGDALSSLCALGLIADRLGKKKKIFAQGQGSQAFDYLPGFFSIVSSYEAIVNNEGNWIEDFDLMVVTDCGALSRTALETQILKFKSQGGKIIEFDHHPRIDDYASLELRDPSLSSTAELVYNFIVINNIELDRDLADCILTGIMADTGNLLYPSATGDTLQVSSSALAAGARYAKILQAVSGGKNLAVMKLWGLVINRLQLNKSYQLAISIVTQKDIREIFKKEFLDTATESELFSDLVGFLSNHAGVKGVLLLHEDRNGFVKGSLRSTAEGFMVNKLAQALGGGGHERAAGFAISGKFKQIDNFWQIV